MKTRSKLIFLKYYECPQVAMDFGATAIQQYKLIDHNILLLTTLSNRDIKGIFFDTYFARITFRDEKWYYSIEPRIECDQRPLISMANLARNHAIRLEDNVAEFYWFRAVYKVEDIYR